MSLLICSFKLVTVLFGDYLTALAVTAVCLQVKLSSHSES